MSVSLVVADDHEVVRAGFAALLDTQPDFTVLGTASDGESAVLACRELKPDVVLMDVRMPGIDGIEATRQLAPDENPPRVLILTTFDLDEYVFDALAAGASGFLLKRVSAEQLVASMRLVAAGGELLAPSITRRLIERVGRQRARPTASREVLSNLSAREHEVLELMAQGLSNAELATILHLGQTTVKSHVSAVLSKLGLRDRVQAVVLANQLGLTGPASPGSEA